MYRSRYSVRSLILGTTFCAFGVLAPNCHAQVATQISSDGTLATTVTQTGNVFDINGGTITGSNQFHSFDRFSVGTGDIASFNGPGGIQNIISRVTGGSGSEIDGTLRSTIPGANLFLMNPAGILFGPNANLDVQGSFHATTADYLKLGTDGVFYVNPEQSTVLSVAPPSAFGFLVSNPAPVEVQSGVFDFNVGAFANVMQVPVGKTLSFVGGSVTVGAAPGAPPAGFLFAPEGRINVVSVASAGEAEFDGTGFGTDSFTKFGDVNITGNSIIDGSEVYIRGGQLTIEGGTIFPGLFYLAGAPVAPPNGGEVNIEASEAVNIIGQEPVLAATGIQTFAGSGSGIVPGDVPDISIKSPSVTVTNGALIQTSRLGPGNPSDVLVEADNVEVTNGASIGLVNSFAGPGGTLTVNATDVTLDSQGNGGFTGLAAQANFHPAYGQPGVPFLPDLQLADSGSIKVNATGELVVRDRAQISTDSFAFGRSGDITINAGDMNLVGAGTNTASIAAQSGLAGQSGEITINVNGNISLENGFRITANTLGSGDGGQTNITAGQSLTMTGTSTFISSTTSQPLDSELTGFAQLFDPYFQFFYGVATPDYPSLREALGIAPGPNDLMQVLAALSMIPDPSGSGYPLVAVTDFTPGTGGDLSVTTPVLSASADARIETSTAWDGNAGAIVADVDTLTLDAGAIMGSRSGADRLDRGPTAGSGNAGLIQVTATDSISVQGRSADSDDSSSITTSTFGDGNGGDIVLNAGKVAVNDGGSITSETGGNLGGEFVAGSGSAGKISMSGASLLSVSGANSTVSTTTNGDGLGGSIELTSNANVEIVNGGSVTSDSFGTGLAGDISIAAGNKINMNYGTISTRAVTADGGNITLTAPELVYLLNSDITTSVESGFGGGGNITIDPQFVILNQSNILANAFGGPGGNITIVADNVISSAQSSIDASSALGINGTVNISSPDQDVAQELAVLPENFLDVTGLISDRCGTAAGSSSLVSAGPGGLAVDPDGYLPSFGTMTNAGYNGDGENSAINSGKPWWALAVDTSALQLAQVTCTR